MCSRRSMCARAVLSGFWQGKLRDVCCGTPQSGRAARSIYKDFKILAHLASVNPSRQTTQREAPRHARIASMLLSHRAGVPPAAARAPSGPFTSFRPCRLHSARCRSGLRDAVTKTTKGGAADAAAAAARKAVIDKLYGSPLSREKMEEVRCLELRAVCVREGRRLTLPSVFLDCSVVCVCVRERKRGARRRRRRRRSIAAACSANATPVRCWPMTSRWARRGTRAPSPRTVRVWCLAALCLIQVKRARLRACFFLQPRPTTPPRKKPKHNKTTST